MDAIMSILMMTAQPCFSSDAATGELPRFRNRSHLSQMRQTSFRIYATLSMLKRTQQNNVECAALIFLGRHIPEHGGTASPAFPKCNKNTWAQ